MHTDSISACDRPTLHIASYLLRQLLHQCMKCTVLVSLQNVRQCRPTLPSVCWPFIISYDVCGWHTILMISCLDIPSTSTFQQKRHKKIPLIKKTTKYVGPPFAYQQKRHKKIPLIKKKKKNEVCGPSLGHFTKG